MAQGAQGVIAYWTTVTGAASSANPITMVGWNGPNYSAAAIDITSLQSTAKEKLIGVYDAGQISIDCNFDATDIGGTANTLGKLRESMVSRTRGKIQIQFSTASTTQKVEAEAYVTGMSIQGSVDNKISCSITIDLNGGGTWTT